jgi:hypothetical protein
MGENGENSESNNNGPRNQSNKPKIPPAEEVETGALEVVRKESREVLKHQIELLGDIDDKAMRTVRTSVLFIGLVISAIRSVGIQSISTS